MNKRDIKSGFALTEIIVAIMIIGLMVGIGFGAFRYIKTARVKKSVAKMAEVQTALGQYEVTANEYPVKLSDLIEKPAQAKGWQGPYLDSEDDLKDAWGNELQYKRNSKGQKPPYELYSFGPNGEAATESEYISAQTR